MVGDGANQTNSPIPIKIDRKIILKSENYLESIGQSIDNRIKKVAAIR